MKRIYLLSGIVFLLLLSLPSFSALSLAGQLVGPITYVPGSSMSVHYKISDTSYPVKVSVDASPFSQVRATEVVNNEFDLIFDFPADEHIPPGEYKIGVSVVENSEDNSASIGSQVSVSKVFYVTVLSYEKAVTINLAAPNINEGNNVTFTLTVKSVGYPHIDAVQGKITVHNHQQEILGTIFTEKKSLPGLQGLTFKHSFDSSNFPTGAYEARAIVSYDGKFETTNTTFLIGNMDIIVLNYTSLFFPGFNDFVVILQNNWGNRIRNVYAKLFVGEQELFHTHSIDLEPWQEGKLKGIAQIPFEPGAYGGILRVFFEGEQKDMAVSLQVMPLPSAVQGQNIAFFESIYFFPTVAILLLFIIILTFMILRKYYKAQR